LNVIERLIQENVAILREDIEKLQRLMQEFEAELAALGARVDNLEGRVAFLEDHQFSTTTKLAGEVIIAATGNSEDNNQIVMGDRVRLELNTSFTGDDRLVTRLAARNLDPFKNNYSTNVDFDGGDAKLQLDDVTSAQTTQTFNIAPGGGNEVFIDWLAYYTPIRLGENLRLNTYIAGFGGIHSDYAQTTNPYFEDYDGGNGALSAFASESPIYRIGGGSGIATSLELGFLKGLFGSNSLTLGYLAGGAGDPRQGQGLFNGDYAALAQLNFGLWDRVSLGFTYVHGFHKTNSPIFGMGATDIDADGSRIDTNLAGVTGTALANLSNNNLNAALDQSTIRINGDEFSGTGQFTDFDFKSKVTNSYGAELAWRITNWLTFSGFFNYTNVTLTGRTNEDIWTYGGGFAFPDLGKEGSVLGIFAGVQPYLGDGRIPVTVTNPLTGDELTGDAKFGNSNPVHIEAFYKYQLTDNISLTPGVIYLINPEQSSSNDDQVIGTIRTTFTF
jgi:hypothetical protein